MDGQVGMIDAEAKVAEVHLEGGLLLTGEHFWEGSIERETSSGREDGSKKGVIHLGSETGLSRGFLRWHPPTARETKRSGGYDLRGGITKGEKTSAANWFHLKSSLSRHLILLF